MRNDHLRAAPKYDEVVLWFEHDLLDQLQVLELLNWFEGAGIGSTELTMICINQFPGFDKFRGIGQLNCEQMETLLPKRSPVTHEQMQLAKSAWAAFRSDDPRNLENLVDTDTSALPFLKAALQRHLQEYPWVRYGLTRTERQILTVVASGVVKPGRVFVENMELEEFLYIGDWPTYQVIANLSQLAKPMLMCAPSGRFRHPPEKDLTPEEFQQQELSLTDEGREVLLGTRHARTPITRDEWLGGVHLTSDKPMWAWDDTATHLALD